MWWVILALVSVLVFRSRWFKGEIGEASIRLAAGVGLPGKTYYRIHNITLPTPDGSTQIDHVFVSRFGIFVVETKNMKGWIFGGERQAQWTQQLFRKPFKFQNPLRQNYKHVKALQAVLDVPSNTIHSVVVFVGACAFKSPMPKNVTKGVGCISYIRSFSIPVLSESQVRNVVLRIRDGRFEPTRETHREHVRRLKGRSDPSAARKCPKCGSDMVLRTAKRGPREGRQFWGCSAYPKCRVVQNITQ